MELTVEQYMDNGRECRRLGVDKYTDSKSDQLRYYPYQAGLPELKKGAYEAERGYEKSAGGEKGYGCQIHGNT